MNKKVFTIIVTYNGLKWLDKTLQSLEKSTLKSTVLIIDNHSTDNTCQYIQQNFPWVTLIKLDKNIGFGRANNVAIKEALAQGAEHVFLLNQDAYVHPGTIASLVELQTQHQEFGILSPMHLNGKGDRLDYQFSTCISPPFCDHLLSHLILKKDDLDRVYETDFVNAAAWLISKECLNKVGGFDPLFFMYGEDNDYIVRVLTLGFKVGIVPGTYINHDREDRDDTKFSSKKTTNREWCKYLLILKDTKQNYFKALVTVNLRLFKEMFKALLTFDLKWVSVYSRVLFRIMGSLFAIKKSRQS
jgi:GT2 family glycosyltransferase